jgi:ATP-dependent DNA ligase
LASRFFNALLFGRQLPIYCFDLMVADGQDVRTAPLKERRAMLAKIVRAALAPLTTKPHYRQSNPSIAE